MRIEITRMDGGWAITYIGHMPGEPQGTLGTYPLDWEKHQTPAITFATMYRQNRTDLKGAHCPIMVELA